MGLQEQKALESRYVMPTFARKEVEFVSGSGMEVVDSQGKTYLDFLSGIGVCGLGHCHPALVKAIKDQAEKLIHVSNYYYIEDRGEVAESLSDLMNAHLPEDEKIEWQAFFANSGAEANECSIKLARLYARNKAAEAAPEGQKEAAAAAAPRLVVTMERSFHGRTLATLAATAQPVKQELFQPLPSGFVPTPLNDVAALEQLFAEQGDQICAVILECIQGESGVNPCTKEFMQAVRRLCDERGALLICDEVQCGMFRTGKPFGFQNFDVTPDIASLAKGIASGFPMGASVARADVAATYAPGVHGSTFGGSNLAIAAARASINAYIEENVGQNALEVGEYMRQVLANLPGVVSVRGMGLMNAVDLEEGLNAPSVVNAALEAGLILNATGPSTLRFLPPLICSREDVDELAKRLAPLLER